MQKSRSFTLPGLFYARKASWVLRADTIRPYGNALYVGAAISRPQADYSILSPSQISHAVTARLPRAFAAASPASP